VATVPIGWAKVSDAARYAGVGQRTFRKWFSKGLRWARAPTGAILVKIEWIDAFLEGFTVNETDNTKQIVDSVLEGLV